MDVTAAPRVPKAKSALNMPPKSGVRCGANGPKIAAFEVTLPALIRHKDRKHPLLSLRKSRFVTNWDQTVSDHAPGLFRLASRILGGGNDAEDVVQEAFCEAYQLQQGQTVDNWGGLLRRIVTHRAVDRLRKRRATVSLDGLEPSARTHNPEHAAIARELGERLRRAIGELPERQAAVFCLRYFDDLPYAQIAETLGIDPSAVGTALNKARGKLKSLLTA